MVAAIAASRRATEGEVATMDVDVGEPGRLLRHHYLENYLTPLFGERWLPPGRFALVRARKFVGGGSRIMCGHVRARGRRRLSGG